MKRRRELAERLDDLEKRLKALEAAFGGLKQMSLTLEATLEVFAERGLVPRGLINRDHGARKPQRGRIGQDADEAVQQFVNSLLDELMESLDEAQMPHG